MVWEILSQLATNPTLDFILKIALIIASGSVAITFGLNYNIYRKMRTTDQIKLAHDFFVAYKELKEKRAALHEQGKQKDQVKEWAERFFDELEWFSYLVNTQQITNPRLLRFYEQLILDSYEKVLPNFYTQEQRNDINFYPELDELYQKLKEGKFNIYRRLKEE
jgi:uncharacterized protein with gpF-like domain